MCSLTDFIETSLGRCGGWVSTATVTGQGASLVDASVRGGDFSWPKAGTFRGHQRGHQLAITGDFFMATDSRTAYASRTGESFDSGLPRDAKPVRLEGDCRGEGRHRSTCVS